MREGGASLDREHPARKVAPVRNETAVRIQAAVTADRGDAEPAPAPADALIP
jgi:hypothetical protein